MRSTTTAPSIASVLAVLVATLASSSDVVVVAAANRLSPERTRLDDVDRIVGGNSPCNGGLELELHVQTDDRGGTGTEKTAVALYSILPDFSDLGDLVLIDEDLEPNRLHVLPDDDVGGGSSPLCLEDDRCYLFAITVDDDDDDDLTGGGGATMPEGGGDAAAAAAGSYFRGYLGGEEVFSSGGRGEDDDDDDDGGFFGDYDDRMFCTGTAAIPDHVTGDHFVDDGGGGEGVPTAEPTTGFPTQVPTTGFPTQVPTTGFPTQVPTTGFPTQVPTREFNSRHPSGSPSAFPSASPSASPSATPSSAPSGAPSAGPTTPVCEDDPDFAFRNRSRWNCKGYIKGRNTARQIKRCNKVWDGKPVHDWCPHRCGSRVGVGPCAHLHEQKRGKAAKTSKKNGNEAPPPAMAMTMAAVARPEQTTETERVQNNIFSINRVTTTNGGGGSRGDEGNYHT